MKQEQKLLKIEDIEFDQSLYPRSNPDWIQALRYAEAMRSGAVFPPIKVALFNGRLILIDGKHRIDAKRTLKEEYIESIVIAGLNEKEIYIEAVKSNIAHGKVLSTYDRVNIIRKLEEFELDMPEISKIINIPTDKITNFVAQRLTTDVQGNPVVLKSGLRYLNKQSVDQNFEEQQKSFSGARQEILHVKSLLLMLRNMKDREFDKKFLEDLNQLKSIIDEIIMRIKVSK